MPFKRAGQRFGQLPPKGSYVGELVGVIDGPIFRDRRTGESQPKLGWVFRLFNLNGTPYVDTVTGEAFIATALTNETTAQRSTAREWFEAMTGLTVGDEDDPEDLVVQSLGTRLMLNFGKNTNGNVKLSQVMAFEGDSTLTQAERDAILATFPPRSLVEFGEAPVDEPVTAGVAAQAVAPPPAIDAARERAAAAASAAAGSVDPDDLPF
jgi:hypothetical protein